METPKVIGDGVGEDFVDIILDIYNDKTAGISVDRDSMKALILVSVFLSWFKYQARIILQLCFNNSVLQDVYAGGTDTTAGVLEWAMSDLLRHPRVMEKLQN